MGQSAQQIIETEIQHSFVGADVNATCFDVSLGLLQAYMKQ
jgi:hypothetical protein